MSFDILRQNKQDVVLIVLDAKSCYDRISPPIASPALARQGTPQCFVDMMFGTIAKMKHHVKTTYGNSARSYRSEDGDFHGILQGNGAGPAIWATVSTPILNSLRDEGFGAHILCPTTSNKLVLPAFAFVVDTDLIHPIHAETSDKPGPQQALDLWEEGLRTTGGEIPEKCTWYAIRHKWEKDKWSLHNMQDMLHPVKLRNDMGVSEIVNQEEPHTAVKSVGIMFAPSGCMVDEAAYF
jgi:hypothetical protein